VAVSEAAYHQQKGNIGITQYAEMPARGHALTIDHGWRYVAETALGFITGLFRKRKSNDSSTRITNRGVQ
jgi:hypothetical protein